MPTNPNKWRVLPNIDKKYRDFERESSLSKLSSELSTIAFMEEEKEKKANGARKLKRQRYRTQPDDRKELQEYKGEINRLKDLIMEKKLERSLMIEDKLRRISRLSTQSVSKGQESPRSAVNYISLSPHSLQSSYNPYHPVPPSLPYIPHPYMHYPAPPPPPYPREYERQSYYRPRRRERYREEDRRARDSVYFQKNYDEYEQPTRYQKMKQAKVQKKPNQFFMKKMKDKLKRKWRAVVWAIVFSQSLPKYAKKIVSARQAIFTKFEQKKFNIEMTLFQKYLVKKCKPFFLFIGNNRKIELTLENEETDRMDTEKAQTAKRLINMLIDGLKAIKIQDTNEPATNPVQLMHMFCKHGAYVEQFMTEEELDVVAFSEKSKYLRLDRNMEISQIINFVCNKILLYNSILNPGKVDAKLFPSDDEVINKNFYFLGSIWYQLCLELQDEYLCQVPQNYDIGNWRKLKDKLNIQPAKSLAVNGSPKEEDEMISGLLGKKKIQQLFGKNFWRKQKAGLKSALQNLYGTIVSFHEQLKQKIKF